MTGLSSFGSFSVDKIERIRKRIETTNETLEIGIDKFFRKKTYHCILTSSVYFLKYTLLLFLFYVALDVTCSGMELVFAPIRADV